MTSFCFLSVFDFQIVLPQGMFSLQFFVVVPLFLSLNDSREEQSPRENVLARSPAMLPYSDDKRAACQNGTDGLFVGYLIYL